MLWPRWARQDIHSPMSSAWAPGRKTFPASLAFRLAISLSPERWTEGMGATRGLGHNAPCRIFGALSSPSITTLGVICEDGGFTRYKQTGSLSYHWEESPREPPRLRWTVEEGRTGLYYKTPRFEDCLLALVS